MRLLLPALLLPCLLAAGCSETVQSTPCPGTPVGTFTFTGTRTLVSCADGSAPAAGVNSLYPPEVKFTGTITSSGAGTSAALCVAHPGAEPMVGTRSDDLLDVSVETRGALLSGCNAACAVTVNQEVSGTLQRDPGGLPSGFTGTLVDTETKDATIPSAACTPCVTPCQASYVLTAVTPVP